MNTDTGKYIIFAGVLIVLLGVLIYFFHDKLNWIGRLPGDIRIEKENFKFYFPITTTVIFSLVVTIIIQVIKRIL
jgi:O-antigen/teichoic acid export membrane protein